LHIEKKNRINSKGIMVRIKIQKPSIILTSAGRTGTLFFSKLFESSVDNIDSFHMPDKLMNLSEISAWKKQIEYFGLYNITVARIRGKYGIRFLSDQALARSKEQAYIVDALFKHRYRFLSKLPHTYYAECNPTFYGLIPYINLVWERAVIIYIVRNGYDWIRSHMNWGQWYKERKCMSPLTRRINPTFFLNDPHKEEWDSFDRFKKLCWAWNKLNSIILEDLHSLQNARLFRFEDLFKKQTNHEDLIDLIEFATSGFSSNDVHIGKAKALVNQKINSNINTGFPERKFWTTEMHRFFNKNCGELMLRLGYPLDGDARNELEDYEQ